MIFTQKANRFRNIGRITDVSNFKFIAGILLGLFSAFVIYSFSFVVFEIFRVSSVTEDGDMWMPSDDVMNFFKLFAAYLSFILAQSLTFNFWWSGPRRIHTKFNYKRNALLNDIKGFNWYFASWFFRFTTVTAIYFLIADKKGYYVLKLYPEYNYVYVLILLVLFQNAWLPIRTSFLKGKLKLMLFTAIVISFLSLGLSRINIVDYKGLNDSFKKSYIAQSAYINLPEFDTHQKLENKSLISYTYFVSDSVNKSNPKIILENELFTPKNYQKKVKYISGHMDKINVSRQVYTMYIDSAIQMKYINDFKRELTKYNMSRIAYAIKPTNQEYYNNFIYSNINFAYRQKPIFNKLEPEQPVEEIRITLADFTKVKLNYNKGNYYINDEIVNKEDLSLILRTIAYNTENYFFIIKVEEDLLFYNYFIMWSSIIKGMNDMWNDLAFKEHQCSFNDLYGIKMDKIVNRYPIRIFEVNEKNKDIFVAN